MSKHANWNERWSDIKCQCPQGKLHFKCENTKQWSDLKALGLTVHFAIQKGLYFPFCHQGISVGIQESRMVKKCVRRNKVFEYFIRSYSLFWQSWSPPPNDLGMIGWQAYYNHKVKTVTKLEKIIRTQNYLSRLESPLKFNKRNLLS